MKKHTKIYMTHFNYTIADFIGCENCGAKSVDIHHIDNKGMGGSNEKDYIENLIALCQMCHTNAHQHTEFNQELKKIHLLNL